MDSGNAFAGRLGGRALRGVTLPGRHGGRPLQDGRPLRDEAQVCLAGHLQKGFAAKAPVICPCGTAI